MNNPDKTRHIQEVETTVLRTKRPLRIERDEQRRFIRVEVAAPMSLRKIKDGEGNYWPQGDWHVINGTILNLSAGGVLVDLDQAVEEGDVVCLRFTLHQVEGLENVLGLVKRADLEPDGCIAGIEFISADYLVDHFSQSEIDLLDTAFCNFDESVRRVLNRYVYQETGQSEI